jgi:hypothetical protein
VMVRASLEQVPPTQHLKPDTVARGSHIRTPSVACRGKDAGMRVVYPPAAKEAIGKHSLAIIVPRPTYIYIRSQRNSPLREYADGHRFKHQKR